MSPALFPTSLDDSFDEQLYTGSPLANPFDFEPLRKRAAGSLSFESANLVGTDTFCQPDGSSDGYTFAETLIQQNFASDAVGNGPA